MTDDDPNEADELMPMPTGPEPAPSSSVNKITWAQVGRVTEPGRYIYTFGWLTVTADDLAIWEKYPNAAFTRYSMAAATEPEGETVEEFRLGTFGLRENLSLSEK